MSTAVVGCAAALLVLGTVLRLVTQRRMRVRYASFWLAVSAATVVVAAVPGLLTRSSTALGFAVPANLLFLAGIVLLLLVGISLTVAITSLEDRVQRLAEEVAMLNERTPARLRDVA